MPELPEVEILVRYLKPLLESKVVRSVEVRRERTLATTTRRQLSMALRGARFVGVERRGKYLLFSLEQPRSLKPITLVGHLGMTGRMYLLPARAPLPKHAAVVLHLSEEQFVFEDTRYFGRLTLDQSSVKKLGVEPLDPAFTATMLAQALNRSIQPIKVNIYASEALFRARISPIRPSRKLTGEEIHRLWTAIRETLAEAIKGGGTVALNFAGISETDGLYYFGRAPGETSSYEERLQVYDRMGLPCIRCNVPLKRLVQAGRSTFFCPNCQRGRHPKKAAIQSSRRSRKPAAT